MIYLYNYYDGNIYLSFRGPTTEQKIDCFIPDMLQIFKINLFGIYHYTQDGWERVKWG